MSTEPPNDVAMERIVLGAMMLSAEVVDEVARVIRDDTFYLEQHARVYRAILAAADAGTPTEPTAVADRLAASGELGKVGGAPFLLELIEAVPTAANAGWYAHRVADLAFARNFDRLAVRTRQLAYGLAREDPAAAVDQVQNELDALTVRPDADDPVPWADLVTPGFDELEAATAHHGKPVGLPTGFIDLDRLTGGLKPGHLVIVAGRTSMGKSVAARGLLRSAAFRHKVPSALFTQEMTRGEIFKAVLSAECGIPHDLIENGGMSDAEWTKAARFVADTVDVPFFVDDTAGIGLAEIRAKCRRLHKRHGLGLVVVDYLQLLETSERRENRQVAVAALSRGLKVLAAQLACPVVAVSQLNRGPEQRADKRPQLADLRESGSIENDANLVILIHREDYYDRDSPRKGEADLIVAKHRSGPLDTVTVASQLHLSRFADMAVM